MFASVLSEVVNGNFLIGLREGLEASLIVSILVAYLVRSGRRDRLPAVFAGAGVAVGLSVVTYLGLVITSNELSFKANETFGGTLSVVAVAFVTAMVFWMKRNARTLSGELHEKADGALAGGAFAMFTTAFLATGREGLETALFLGTALRTSGYSAGPSALLGLGLSVVLAYLLYRRSVKIDLARFFRYTGAGLVVVAAGVLAYGLHDLQEAGILGGLDRRAFDISSTIPPSSWYGTLLKGIFNFQPNPTWLQVVAYVGYVVPVMVIFLQRSAPTAADDATPVRRATPARLGVLGAAAAMAIGAVVVTTRPEPTQKVDVAETAAPTVPDAAPRTVTQIKVQATDTSCTAERTSLTPGSTKFSVTNGGDKVTELYVYRDKTTIVSEVENIGPGTTRTLTANLRTGLSYELACKPGMVGDGIRVPLTIG